MSTIIPEFEFYIDLQGASLYQKWLELGNEGDYEDFFDWLRIKGDAGTTISRTVEPTDSPLVSETGDVYWYALKAGTYTNFGGVVVPANSLAIISRVGGVFDVSSNVFDFSGYISKTADKGVYGDPNKWIDGKQIKDAVLTERGNLNKDVLFTSFPSTGFNNWRDLASGNTHSVVNGVLTVVTMGSDSNISRNITQDLPMIGDTLLIAATITIPSGVVFTAVPHVQIVVFTNVSNYNITPAVSTKYASLVGENKTYYKVKLDQALLGDSTSINSIRLDCRPYKAGVSFANIQVYNRFRVEYTKSYIVDVATEVVNSKLKPEYVDFLDTYAPKFSSILIPTDAVFNSVNTVPSSKVTETLNPDGSIKLSGTISGTADYLWANFKKTTVWLSNHHYYVAIKVHPNVIDGSTDGNFYPQIRPKLGTGTTLGTGVIKQTVIIGDTGIIKADVKTTFTGETTGKDLFVQFKNVKFEVGESVDIDFIDICIYDLGVTGSETFTYNEFDEIFSANPMQPSYGTIHIDGLDVNAGKGEGGGTTPVVYNVQVTGDSLAAQDWWKKLTNNGVTRIASALAFGGQKSSFIRDQFLASLDTSTINRTHIFYLGRNNYTKPSTVVNDLRIMIDAIGHNRFLIMSPPNGGYGNLATGSGEYKNGTNYLYFLDLEERLLSAYPNNYINTRKALIDGFDNGKVRLLAPFTQPAINGNVQISVSDTAILTTQNASDVANEPNYANRIIIGTDKTSKYDIYQVVSIDSATLMTVKLQANNSGIAPASLVANGDDVGSVIYLEIMQYLDLATWQNKAVQSTCRADGVHLSTRGKDLLSKIVSQALLVRGF